MALRQLAALVAAAALAACSGSDPILPSDGEPNDTVADATPIATSTPAAGVISTAGDVDYYGFTVPAGGAFVRVQTFDAGGTGCEGVDTLTELVEADGTAWGAVVAWDDDSGPYWCDDLVEWLPEGTYFVAVSFGGAAAPGFAYSVLVTLDPGDTGDSAEIEPNGTAATASGPYTADTLVEGTISSATDEDYFEISNTTGSTRSVYVETFQHGVGYCPGANSTLDLYDANGYWIADDDDDGVLYCSRLAFTLPAYTTALVAVGGHGGTFSYLLEIDFL